MGSAPGKRPLRKPYVIPNFGGSKYRSLILEEKSEIMTILFDLLKFRIQKSKDKNQDIIEKISRKTSIFNVPIKDPKEPSKA